MRLRARGNGKGTHDGCLCCIFARRRGQKHRENTFLMPLFGGAGQTGEGREGQTGVEEDAGVSGLGRVLLILGCGGGVVVIRTSQRFALCGTANAGLWIVVVGRIIPSMCYLAASLYAITSNVGTLFPMVFLIVRPLIIYVAAFVEVGTCAIGSHAAEDTGCIGVKIPVAMVFVLPLAKVTLLPVPGSAAVVTPMELPVREPSAVMVLFLAR